MDRSSQWNLRQAILVGSDVAPQLTTVKSPRPSTVPNDIEAAAREAP
jgi:hypothetical protein